MKTRVVLCILLYILLFAAPGAVLFAQVMQSTTYKITRDSLNAGGQDSTSTNYDLGDTVGEAGSGDSSSSNYALSLGYQQMEGSFISITSPADLPLSSIGGITGANSEGVVSWQITTDNPAGYTMDIRAATAPALTSASDSFADYTPAGADPDYNFSISSSSSAFGFSPEGSDASSRFKDNGSVCNTGSGETSDKCWDGLSTTPKTIAGKATSNQPAGSAVNVRFRAESGSAHIQTSGSYSASIIVTAIVL